MADVTDQQIADAAAAPSSVSVDGVSVTNRPVSELIDAQTAIAEGNSSKPRRGVLFAKMIPGSSRGS